MFDGDVIRSLQRGQSVVIYYTKSKGEMVAWRLQDVSDHSHTTLILQNGETHEQYHGQARHQGDVIARQNGAKYFVAYARNVYDDKVTERNRGRL